MRVVTASAITLMATAFATADDKPAGSAGGDASYVKIEIKGTLSVLPSYAFNPKPDLATGKPFGASVMAGSITSQFQLLADTREQFDKVKANGGKRVVITGELESRMLPYDPGHPPIILPVWFFIRVRDVRLADSK